MHLDIVIYTVMWWWWYLPYRLIDSSAVRPWEQDKDGWINNGTMCSCAQCCPWGWNQMGFTHQAHTKLEFLLPGTHNVLFAPVKKWSVRHFNRNEHTIVSETVPYSVVNVHFHMDENVNAMPTPKLRSDSVKKLLQLQPAFWKQPSQWLRDAGLERVSGLDFCFAVSVLRPGCERLCECDDGCDHVCACVSERR